MYILLYRCRFSILYIIIHFIYVYLCIKIGKYIYVDNYEIYKEIMQLFAYKWRILTGGVGGDMGFMTHRHNEHQLKVGIPARAPAAVYTWEALPDSQLSLLFLSPAARLLLPRLRRAGRAGCEGRRGSSHRASPRCFCSFAPLISVCVSFHNPYILRLAFRPGNAKSVYIRLTSKLIEKLKDRLWQCLSRKDSP